MILNNRRINPIIIHIIKGVITVGLQAVAQYKPLTVYIPPINEQTLQGILCADKHSPVTDEANAVAHLNLIPPDGCRIHIIRVTIQQ